MSRPPAFPFAAALLLGAAVGVPAHTVQANVQAEVQAETQAHAAAPAQTDASRILELPYLERELDNGLKIIIMPADTPGLVSLQIPVQTGSRNEVEEGKSGFAHFFEHMMFRGTPSYPADEYQAVIQAAGGDQNAYTSSDLTNYYINFTTADLEKILEVEADRFQNLRYSEEQFRTEALAVRGEYLKNYANPLLKGFEVLSELAFDEHTYGHTTMGYFDDIVAMPDQMEYSRVFFERWYRPEYTTLIVVGDVEPEATAQLIERYWGDWKRGSYQVEVPQEPPLSGPRYSHLAWDGPTQPWLINAWRGPAFDADSADTPALMLMAELYFGATSELYQQLVVRERLVDQFFANAPTNKDPGLFTIGARLTDPGHAEAVVTAIQDTLLRARTEEFDATRVAETKSRVKYAFAATLDSAASIGATLARFVHHERDPETLNRLYARFDRVTPDEMVAAANRVFVDANRASVSIATQASLPGANAFRELDPEVAAAAEATPGSDIVLIAQPTDAALVDVRITFQTGAAFDPPGKTGLAQLSASMLANGGSARRGYAELQQAFHPIASGLSVQVDKELVTFSATVHRDNLQTWHGLVREMLLEPGLREDDFQRLRQQQANAIRTTLRDNNDEELAKEALYEMVYGPAHPYGRLSLGHASQVEALTLEDVRDFITRRFTRGNVGLGLAGGYDDAFAQRLLGDLDRLPEGGPGMLAVAPVERAERRSARVIEKQTPGVAVSFGWPIELKRGDDDWIALWLVRSWLGEHRNSGGRLYQRIREERGMNYGSYAYIEYFPAGMFRMQPEPGYPRRNDLFQVWLRPLRDNNDALFATRAALWELDRLVEDGLSQQQFEASRNFLHKFVAILTSTSATRLGYATDSEWYGTPDFIDYVRRGLEALTLEQVNAAIRRHIHTDSAQFVFVTGDGEELAAALAGDVPSPIEYNTAKSEALMAEDEEIASQAFGLSVGRIEVVDAGQVFE